MGGIAGILHFDGSRPAWRDGLAMSAAVAHRGRDDEGYFWDGPALMAQDRNRVSADGCRQPIVTGRYVLAFDGRHYDHLDLARQVRQAGGASPDGLGDAEVLLQAWEAWGQDCLQRLDGSYAFALWDRRDEELTLVRGPTGFRTLFYTSSGGRFAFASVPAALVRLPWVSRELNLDHLAEYLSFRYVHAPRTLLRDVSSLPPGCVLQVNGRGSRIRAFSQPSFCPPGTPVPDDDDALAEVDHQIGDAVQRRCQSGQPVAVLLSGGLDSTLLARHAIAAGRTVHTYHLIFDGTGVDEAAFAGRAATLLGTRHRDVRVDGGALERSLEAAVQAMGVPIPDPSAIALHAFFEQVRAEHRVALCGAGGDELFAGGRVAVAADAWRRASGSLSGVPGRLLAALRGQGGMPGDRSPGGASVVDATLRARLLLDTVPVRPSIRSEILGPFYAQLSTDPVNQVLGVAQRGALPEDGVAVPDRMGLACGVEVRFPYLDRRVVAFLNQQPGTWKLGSRLGRLVPKRVVRQLLQDILPPRMVDRPKVSWPRPLQQWLRGAGACFLAGRFDRLLASPWGLWRPEPVRELVRDHQQGRRDRGGVLWLLILLDAWLEHLRSAGSAKDVVDRVPRRE